MKIAALLMCLLFVASGKTFAAQVANSHRAYMRYTEQVCTVRPDGNKQVTDCVETVRYSTPDAAASHGEMQGMSTAKSVATSHGVSYGSATVSSGSSKNLQGALKAAQEVLK